MYDGDCFSEEACYSCACPREKQQNNLVVAVTFIVCLVPSGSWPEVE